MRLHLFPFSICALVFVLLPTETVCYAQSSRLRDDSARSLFELANRERASFGLTALRWDNALALAAARHAQRMAASGSISHQYAGEPDLPERFSVEGARFSVVAENVAVSGSPGEIHREWMHSPGHRANILDANMTELGVGVVRVNGRMYAVEDFAHAVASVSLDEQERRVEQLVAAHGLTIAINKTEARRICDGGHAARGERRPLFTMHYTTHDLGMLPAQLLSAAASGRYRDATVGACASEPAGSFSSYHLAVLLF